jgi:hypothetical protein
MRADERQQQLIEAYHQAVKKYNEAVSRLLHLKGSDFDRVYQEVEALRLVSERCRAALEKYK